MKFKHVKYECAVMWLRLTNLFRRSYNATCGHKTKEVDACTAYGKKVMIIISINEDCTPFCHECLKKMTIRCAGCGEPIFIGDPIIAGRINHFNEIPEHASSTACYEEEGVMFYVFGMCCGEFCLPSGFWVPPGRIEHVSRTADFIIGDGDEY